MRTLIIAGTSSGAGKTTVALGLMTAFAKRGLTVAPFKAGPDYIDPLFHRRVCGRPSYNLDGWMMGKEAVLKTFGRVAAGADIAVIEGVMGLFDGYDAAGDAGSTAEIAKWLGAPVILVVNAGSMARSAAALVRGFETFDEELSVAGVIFNNTGGVRHKEWLFDAVCLNCRAEPIGALKRDGGLALPERHLGLTTDAAEALTDDWVGALAVRMEREVDLDRLMELAGESDSLPAPKTFVTEKRSVRLGIARDKAFCFYYEENLDLLRSMGAELVPFSPIADGRLPEGIDGLYLGGGYPEAHAGALSANLSLLAEIRGAAEAGLPVYGECGGMIYLSSGLYDTEGNRYPMAGVFPFYVKMLERREALGYVTVRIREENLLGSVGAVFRGHEFHYSRTVDVPDDLKMTVKITRRTGDKEISEGYQVNNVYGSYLHLHFGAFPRVAEHIVGVMRKFKETGSKTMNHGEHRPLRGEQNQRYKTFYHEGQEKRKGKSKP
ncbi:MAG: cobyrinate a,c-diamide synthase [Deltaproteobacteria bacterium]|nr:cobyrinate a,c-diamide synthase [Deltaproteobacteria bacterium]